MISGIKKIKKQIRRFVDVRVRLIKEQQHNDQQTHFNYSQLSQLFNEETFIPFSAWAISPSTILHVLNDITINKRKSIIEFGAGASTFYIAKLLKVLKIDAKFYSIESDENWVKELQRQLKIYGLEQHVKIVYTPLTDVQPEISFKTQKTWYDTKILEIAFKDIPDIDLVLVDGPFGGSTPYARYSALPFLLDKLTENASIYLDDVQRQHEHEIANTWKAIYGGHIHYIERYMVLNKVEQPFDVSPFQLQNLPM
jgi:predicted O-methyltransferase YrrM